MYLKLIEPTEGHLLQMHEWMLKEPNRENYSCRLVKEIPEYEQWLLKKNKQKSIPNVFLKSLIDTSNPSECLGKFEAFDYNARNQNIEIGYFFPEINRAKGFGSFGLSEFVRLLFNDSLPIRKLTAWTSELNIPSQKILESAGFLRDAELRDHFMIEGKFYNYYIYSLIETK